MLTQLVCSLSAAGVASLAAALPLALEELNLGGNGLGDENAEALAGRLSPRLRILRLACKCYSSLCWSSLNCRGRFG